MPSERRIAEVVKGIRALKDPATRLSELKHWSAILHIPEAELAQKCGIYMAGLSRHERAAQIQALPLAQRADRARAAADALGLTIDWDGRVRFFCECGALAAPVYEHLKGEAHKAGMTSPSSVEIWVLARFAEEASVAVPKLKPGIKPKPGIKIEPKTVEGPDVKAMSAIPISPEDHVVAELHNPKQTPKFEVFIKNLEAEIIKKVAVPISFFDGAESINAVGALAKAPTPPPDIFVAGFAHGDAVRHPAKVVPDAVVTFVAEPENLHDRRAIRLMLGDLKLGYVPRIETDKFHPHLKSGRAEGYIHTVQHNNPAHRQVLVRLGKPAVPAQIASPIAPVKRRIVV